MVPLHALLSAGLVPAIALAVALLAGGTVWAIRRWQRAWIHRWVGAVAHEVKTPVAVLRLYADRLAAAPHRAEDFARVLSAQAQTLAQRIDRLLDLAAGAAARPLRLERVALGEWLGRIADDFRLLAAERQIRLECSTPKADVPLAADEEPLRAAVENLLANALRHSQPGGEIVLVGERVAGWVRIAVRDSGSGVAPGFLARLGQLSGRGGGGQRKLGLGLTLAQLTAEAHGGFLEVASGTGLGTVATLVLPSQGENRGVAAPGGG